MKRDHIHYILALAIGFFLTMFIHKTCFAAEVGISTGSTTGTYYAIGKEIAASCPSSELNVKESNGSLTNISRLFSDNTVTYGIVQLDALLFKGIQESAKMKKIVVLMPLYGEEIHVIGRVGINNLSDLSGKRVVIGKENSGTWVTSQLIKIKTGIQWKDYTGDPKSSLGALLRGEVDAVIYVGGKPLAALTDIGKDGDGVIQLVNIKHPALDSFYSITDIPEGLYPWQSKSASTYAVKSALVTYNYVTEGKVNHVRDLVSCLNTKIPELQETGHPKWKEVEPTAEVKWAVHPVAKQILGR